MKEALVLEGLLSLVHANFYITSDKKSMSVNDAITHHLNPKHRNSPPLFLLDDPDDIIADNLKITVEALEKDIPAWTVTGYCGVDQANELFIESSQVSGFVVELVLNHFWNDRSTLYAQYPEYEEEYIQEYLKDFEFKLGRFRIRFEPADQGI